MFLERQISILEGFLTGVMLLFDQINIAMVSLRDFFQKHLTAHKHLKYIVQYV